MSKIQVLVSDLDNRNLFKGAMRRMEDDLEFIRHCPKHWLAGYAAYLEAFNWMVQETAIEAYAAEHRNREREAK